MITLRPYQCNKVKYYDQLPKDWKPLIGATTAPHGYIWIFNGKSRFGGEYEHGLLKI